MEKVKENIAVYNNTATENTKFFPVQQTVEVPANRLLTIEVPKEVPIGKTVISFTPAVETDTEECPICAKHRDPITGNPRYNAETIAAIEEGRSMMRGETPAKWFNSFDKMIEDLEKDDEDN